MHFLSLWIEYLDYRTKRGEHNYSISACCDVSLLIISESTVPSPTLTTPPLIEFLIKNVDRCFLFYFFLLFAVYDKHRGLLSAAKRNFVAAINLPLQSNHPRAFAKVNFETEVEKFQEKLLSKNCLLSQARKITLLKMRNRGPFIACSHIRYTQHEKKPPLRAYSRRRNFTKHSENQLVKLRKKLFSYFSFSLLLDSVL